MIDGNDDHGVGAGVVGAYGGVAAQQQNVGGGLWHFKLRDGGGNGR